MLIISLLKMFVSRFKLDHTNDTISSTSTSHVMRILHVYLAKRVIELDDVDVLVALRGALRARDRQHGAHVVPLRAHDAHARVDEDRI